MQFSLAVQWLGAGRLEEAADVFDTRLKADPMDLPARLHLGIARLGQGRPAEAAALLQAALTQAPRQPVIQAHLAAAFQALGRLTEALPLYDQALASPDAPAGTAFGRAACLQAMERYDDAIAAYGNIVAQDCAQVEAIYGLARCCERIGRRPDAEAHYRAALAIDPDFAEAAYGLGALLAARGALRDAADCFGQALDVDPDYLEARAGLGRVLLGLDRDAEALDAFRQVLAVEPDQIDVRFGLGVLLARRQDLGAAVEHFRAVLAVDPGHVEARVGLANALLVMGRHPEAIDQARRATTLRPDFAPAADVLAVALSELGDPGAVEQARRALALDPDRLESAYNLVSMSRVGRNDAVLSTLTSRLGQADSLSTREQAWLNFALAKAYDDIGEREAGFDRLMAANAVQRSRIAYDEAAALGSLERVRRVFSADLLAARAGQGDPSEVPVFIVGMPRSGTSLVEQVLASHGAVFGAGERPELTSIARALVPDPVGGPVFPESVSRAPAAVLRAAGADYVRGLRALAPDKARITDKMPGNFMLIGLIRLILPNARIIHLTRDPVDTCLSCYSKLFRDGQPFTYDLGELGRFYRGYQRLMDHWRAVLPPDALLEVSYEQLVSDFPAQARRLVAYAGLPWDDACLRFHETARPVQTASVGQVRQPIYRTSVGRWRPDAHRLAPLIEALNSN